MKKFLLYSLLCFPPASVYPQSSMDEVTTICWDASLSMRDRDTDRENQFLDIYFTNKPNATVTLLIFSNTVIGRETFSIKGGNWTALEDRLARVTYDGGTSYQSLSEYIDGGDILLFTDGKQNTSTVSPNFNGKLYLINCKENYNRANLNLLTILNDAEFVNLSQNRKKPGSLPEPELISYFGTVQGRNSKPEAVWITIKGKKTAGITPEDDGSYQIKATRGDTLVFTVADGKSVEKPLGVNKNINIWLEDSGGIRLDEVVVTEDRRELAEEKMTAYGKKNEDAVGYAVQSITSDDISDGATDVSRATQGKFSGVSLGQNDDLSQIELRPKTSILSGNYGLIVVDGVPMPRSNSSSFAAQGANTIGGGGVNAVQNSTFLDPKNIASITVLKSLAATNRYGSLGANGAVLITTKTASFATQAEKKDLALLTNNVYDEKINVSNKTLVTPYLKELKKGKNIGEAYDLYLEQRERYWDNPTYFLDVYEFFRGSGNVLANRILTNILELESTSLVALKGMLFKMQLEGKHELALETANRILERYPAKIQSYLDVALTEKSIANYQGAMNVLTMMADGSINRDLDFSGLDKTTDREIRNLVYRHSDILDASGIDARYRSNIKYAARVVFDWSNPNAQFELQFVNPQKRFFNWEHTLVSNRDRIRDELNNGYTTEEFEIFGPGIAGEWIINVNYIGNSDMEDTTPTFLKCTIYHNFGLPGQRIEQHLIRLYEAGSKELVAKLDIEQ